VLAFRKVLGLLTPREKRNAFFLLLIVIVMAALETVGIVSIMPFLSVLGDPEAVQTNPFLSGLYDAVGATSADDFLVVLGLSAFAIVVFSAIFRICTVYALNRFVQLRRHSISIRLLESYMRQPYEFFLGRHSGDLAKSILSEVDALVLTVFKPLFDTVAYAVIAFAIVGLLLAVDVRLALTVGVVVGGAYASVFYLVKGVLSRVGRDRTKANQERFMAAGEALSGIKDIKLLGRESAYLQKFLPPSVRFAKHWATNATLSQVPKYLIEAVGVGGILAIALILTRSGGGVQEVLPVLGVYAFAGYRLLPAAQQVYAGLSNLRFGMASVELAFTDLHAEGRGISVATDRRSRIKPIRAIELQRVSYRYPDSAGLALTGIDLVIPIGTSLGIVGGTGAGKTTLVDLILGLLQPSSGALLVDGAALEDSSMRAWQNCLGYVPQTIFLSDATISENVGLGIPREELDIGRVRTCARLAHIDELIEKELPAGYDTRIGERGVRLSGGQRQRLGIARALYHNPDVIVFDEATSALDVVTEAAVVDSLRALAGVKTTITIAHRLSTVRGCDRIVLLDKGQIAASGPYSDLIDRSQDFRKLAAVNV